MMNFYTTAIFELSIYFFFITTSYLAFKKHGKIVLFLFGMIVTIALAIEIPAITSGGYDYLNFLVYIEGYPISLPLGWCVFFYWAHTFSESIVSWDGTLQKALILTAITGILTGSMSMFLEPGGQALGWWKYHSLGASGLGLLDVPAEIFATYFVWGAFDAFVFRMFMLKGWLSRNELGPIYVYYPAICSLTFFSLMVINIVSILPILLFLFPNAVMWAVIYVFKELNFEIKRDKAIPSIAD